MVKKIQKFKYTYLMALLVVSYYIIFHYLPMYGVSIAFKDFNVFKGINDSPWVGLKHFERMFGDKYFWLVTRNTVIISLMKLVFAFPVPILVALLLNELSNIRFKKTVQTIIYLPRFVSWVIIGGILSNFLSINGGVINKLIALLGGEPKIFMQESEYFRTILVVSQIWKETGWGSIIYVAALAGVSPELYEAATIDGAGKLRQAWHISLPTIKPTIIMMFILALANVLNAGFDQVFVLYNDAVMRVGDIIDTFVYRQGLEHAKFSYATAVGLFKSVIGITLILLSDRIFKSMGEEGLL